MIRTISSANPLWGTPRIVGELGKLGIEVAKSTVDKYRVRSRNAPSPKWKAFLENHLNDLVSIDFLIVPTIRFKLLYLLIVLEHSRRKVLYFNVTANPTALWAAQQIVEAFPWDSAPTYLLRDRDAIYGGEFRKRIHAMGMEQVLSAPRSPWQNPFFERLIGTIRRDCLDHVIELNECHLRRIVSPISQLLPRLADASFIIDGCAESAGRASAGPGQGGCVPGARRPASPLRTLGRVAGRREQCALLVFRDSVLSERWEVQHYACTVNRNPGRKCRREAARGDGGRGPGVFGQAAFERYRSRMAGANVESDKGIADRHANAPSRYAYAQYRPIDRWGIEELDQFLLEADGIEESMNISTLDGFLTAIVCGPKTIMPSEWLPWVWDMENGRDASEFKDQAQAQRILGLLMRHMNDIAETLHQAPEHYEPLLMENPNNGDPIPIIDEWCSGFMKGVQLDSDGWLPVVVAKPDWMSTIALYGTEDRWDALEKKNLSLDEHKAADRRLGRDGSEGSMLFVSSNAASKSPVALCQTSCAASLFEIRAKSAATSPVLADRVRSSNSVTVAPTGCTEPRGKFQRKDGFSGGTSI